MAIWDDVLSARDRMVFAKAGYGARGGLGHRPAVLVIDMTYAFTGDRREPILQSLERWPLSSGEAAWDAVAHIRRVVDGARAAEAPVIYTYGAFADARDLGRWAAKSDRALRRPESEVEPSAILDEIAPESGDLVIRKDKPSAFFGTPLMSHLNDLDVDTLVITGCTTSGCVRATVVDGFSYNFAAAVVEECVFDRGETSHKVNLFDMHQKYADVISVKDAVHYLSTRRAS